MDDPYLDAEHRVLFNKFGITRQKDLDDAEADYTSLRLRELAETPLVGDYSPEHFLAFHKYIFGDLYNWAGEYRTIDIEKSEPVLGGLSVMYSDFEMIDDDLAHVLRALNGREWSKFNLNEKAKFLAHDLAELWKIHCFREGNTRTTITFICQFADEKGFGMDRTLFELHSAYVRTALVAYCADFGEDGNFSKPEYLEEMILDALGRPKS